ncbi:MAG: geranylgeranylglycerol-phosphate geranylgeranyltransferase [bacterium]
MMILKLIRWPNLVMILASMTLVLLFVIQPGLQIAWFAGGLDIFQFVILVVATLLVTTGGYVINDLFDLEADRINKPGKNLVGTKFSVASIQTIYWILTLLGVLAGAWLSWSVGRLGASLIFFFSAGLLWFYSERYQCMPLVGNLVVAFLSALSFYIVWIFQFLALKTEPYIFTYAQGSFPLVSRFMLIYGGFAFFVSLLREIVKDVEDREGDERFGCGTMVVVWGLKASRIAAAIVSGLCLAGTILVLIFFLEARFYYLFGYFIAIGLLFVYAFALVLSGKKRSDFKRLSVFIKLLMVVGIASMVLVYFELVR